MEGVEDIEECRGLEEVAFDGESERLRNELHTSTDKLEGQIFEIIPEALMTTQMHLEADKTSEEICSKLDSFVPPFIQWKKDKHEKIASLERRCSELSAKLQSAEIQRENNEAEIEELKNQVSVQNSYFTKIGSILGHLVWRASNLPEMINLWLSDQSNDQILGEFLSVVNTIITVFLSSYVDASTPPSQEQYTFVKGLLGTISNVSANPEGRQFLIENDAGKCLVKNLVTYLPRIPTASGLVVKKLTLVTLWNMCINSDAHRYLIELQIGRVVAHCLDESNSEKIQQLGLDILQSISYNLEPRLLNELIDAVPIEKIRRIARGDREKISSLAREILDYLESRLSETLATCDRYFNK